MIYNPYSYSDSDTMTEIFTRYLEDSDIICDIDNYIFYKAIQIFCIHIGCRKKLIAILNNKMNLKTGSKLVDELGNEFEVMGFEMFSFSCEIPDWYCQFCFARISPEYDTIGAYFAKI